MNPVLSNISKGLLFLTLLLFGYAQGQPDTSTHTLTIATLNCEFLWDGVQPEEGSVNFARKGSQKKAEAHMEEIAGIIRRLDADIINLVEVENLQALQTLNNKYLKNSGYRAYLVNGKDHHTGQDVALLTRLIPQNDRIYRTDSAGTSGHVVKTVTKNYYAKFDIGDLKLAVIGIHFLALPQLQARKFERQAQANAIKNLAIQLKNEGYEPVILGDFNDYDDAVDCLDLNMHLPISNVLISLKKLDPANNSHDLVNISSFIPRMERYTAFYDENKNGAVDYPEEFSAIDHLLVSPALMPFFDHAWIDHTHNPLTLTDHFPVAARFKLKSQQGEMVRLRIESLLPNPAGDESIHESVTLRNTGNTPVQLNGWTMRDQMNTTWQLDGLGSLYPGQTITITRNKQSMALNNNGDTIELVDPMGAVMCTVTYGNTKENEVVRGAE